MKVHQDTTKFTPVHLTLETQEDVDRVFAVFNFADISRAVGGGEIAVALTPYKSLAYQAMHTALCCAFPIKDVRVRVGGRW